VSAGTAGAKPGRRRMSSGRVARLDQTANEVVRRKKRANMARAANAAWTIACQGA